jgi:hypothetical protein
MTWPMTDCSTLELMGSNTLGVMDGYEFASNEFVTALALVSLETQSTEAGFKEFVAVATTIDRGEDLAVRGAVRPVASVEAAGVDRYPGIHLRYRRGCGSAGRAATVQAPVDVQGRCEGPGDGAVRHERVSCVLHGPKGVLCARLA